MFAIIGYGFLLFLSIALLIKLGRFLIVKLGNFIQKVAIFGGGAIFVVLATPAALLGYATFWLFAKVRQQLVGIVVAVGVLWITGVMLGVWGLYPQIPPYTFSSMKILFPAFLGTIILFNIFLLWRVKPQLFIDGYIAAKSNEFGFVIHVSVFLALCSLVSGIVLSDMGITNDATQMAAEFAFWLLSCLVLFYPITQIPELRALLEAFAAILRDREKIRKSELRLELVKQRNSIPIEQISSLIDTEIAYIISIGQFKLIDVDEKEWIVRTGWCEEMRRSVALALSGNVTWDEASLREVVCSITKIDIEGAGIFCEQVLEIGRSYPFTESDLFVLDIYQDKIQVCASCCHAEIASKESADTTWFCSSICVDTDTVCLDIKNAKYDEFITSAATSGLTLMQGGHAWSENHKIFADGGQGHGFAAERGNHKIDRLMGRNSTIAGDDNAKNGPDRIVNGQEIQTKYHQTAARSVGDAFEGQNGNYKYYDSNGQPMPVEVPKDQYAKAVETMRKKISEGRVPGMTDPNDAEKLVRRGSLTYSQAQNITKFGAFESVTYDMAEGVVVGAAAGGISFCITATIYYLHTKDAKIALRAAVVEAGKSFGKTLVVYVSAQQLHRLSSVQALVNHINLAKCPKPVAKFLQDALNVSNMEGVNKVLRGTVVTSLVLIAISTGPDLVKLARGRMSGGVFVKNFAVTTSGVVGGFITGAVGSAFFGPIGMFIGGISGGLVSSKIVAHVAGRMVESDADTVDVVVRRQSEILISTFMLTESEIDNLIKNLETVLTQKVIEQIFSAKRNRAAMANYFIKPLVVMIVRQRPVLVYSSNDVLDSCEEVVPKRLSFRSV